MTGELRVQIRNNMDLKDSEELLAIWQTNDRAEWSEEAFEVIREILGERGVDLPPQNEPIFEHNEEAQKEDEGFSAEELRSIDEDENPPAFYDPFEVLLTVKRIDWMAKVMIVFTVVYNLVYFRRFMPMIQPYFYAFGKPNSPWFYVWIVLLTVLSSTIEIVIIYFSLKTLAHLLRILMEMEFKSRKKT